MSTNRKRSQRQEKSVAKQFNAKTTIASGAFWGMKSDVRSSKFLIECKTTKRDYYRLHAKVWEKVEEEAIKDHLRTPLLIVDLCDSNRYVVFDPKTFTTDIRHILTTVSNYRDDTGASILIEDVFHLGVTAYFFTICGKKNNELCCMKYKDFEYYMLGGD